MFASIGLTDCLREMGLNLMRFKTGTPPRVNRRSIDFSELEVQQGEDTCIPFSFESEKAPPNRAVCHLTYTNAQTHEVIRNNLHRSPLYSGKVKGIGPRYCPSIEDKIVRFSDKPRHQLFLEPMGLNTEEMYVQGFSSSLPEDVQLEMMPHRSRAWSMPEVMRPAYAIEYDCVDPLELQSDAGDAKKSAVCTARGSSAAPPATRRRRRRVWSRASTRRAVPQGRAAADPRPCGRLYRHADRRPGDARHERAVPDDDIPRAEYRLLLRQDNAERAPGADRRAAVGLNPPERLARACGAKYEQCTSRRSTGWRQGGRAGAGCRHAAAFSRGTWTARR